MVVIAPIKEFPILVKILFKCSYLRVSYFRLKFHSIAPIREFEILFNAYFDIERSLLTDLATINGSNSIKLVKADIYVVIAPVKEFPILLEILTYIRNFLMRTKSYLG